jgi:hypothetical protein
MSTEENSSLLDSVVNETEHPTYKHSEPPQTTNLCRWEPCTFILFGLNGETHEEYHKRKGCA